MNHFQRLMKQGNQNVTRLISSGKGPGNIVLLLITRGRKSGLMRSTPLQYELIDGAYCLGSAKGNTADWYRNILADPRVELVVKGVRLKGLAEPVSDPTRVADFLEVRIERHPLMIGLLTRLEGLPLRYTRAEMEKFAAGKAMVLVRTL